ncbi:MAG TPA: hypothetical protein DER09_12580 [Prolixibacteraceae bacterium]|nr:hypothetical protein [Prolixibacteraceae bacterium]
MTEFKSFIFEKRQAKKKSSLLWWIMAGLLILGFVAIYLDVMTNWLSILFIFVPLLIYYYIRYNDWKFGEPEDLNGYFIDELTINEIEIKVASKSIPMDKISSLTITYNNIYGTKLFSSYSGVSMSNGEKNVLIIKLINNESVQYNFKLASIGHAEILLKLTETLKDKVAITNNWKLNSNL